MTVFTSLPTDIVQIILQHIFNRAGPGIKAAKVKIPLLAVCREWRAIVVPMFYNQAYFRSHKQFDFSSQHLRSCFKAQTNIGLISQNGLGDCVRSIVYYSQEEEYAVDSMMCIARMLDISADTCPELDSLMDYHDNNLNTPMDWNNERHITAATTIATTLASKLPNIKRLDMEIDYTHGIISCFSSALTDCFADKLLEFTYSGPLRFTNKRPILGLETVYFSLSKNDEGHNQHPTICPQSIKKLTVIAKGTLFGWNTFNTEQDSNSVVFENLEYLHCKNLNYFVNDGPDTDLRIWFPNIKNMIAQETTISFETIGHQLCSGLRELRYIDELTKILELSQLDLSSLTSLMLKFGPTSSAAADFVASTNALFSRLEGIPTVQCNIYSITNPAYLEGIYWPNLTRFVIEWSIVDGSVFDAVLHMPNLVYLESKNYNLDMATLESLLAYFKTLRSAHTTPSNSNITTLKLGGVTREYYGKFLSSTQVLKWFWPKLATIDMCS